ncbi:cytochrome P450 [Nocardia tengchongensis]|uniref:cytochrome P450 n=1 Tax=Nocardia tengchongensis TaxID=2055889 RepID=UPI00365549C7
MRAFMPSFDYRAERMSHRPKRFYARRPDESPPGTKSVPRVASGFDAVPILGAVTRLWHTVTNPVGLVHSAAEISGGNPFRLRVPTRFDLAYLPGEAGYKTVLSLPADHAAMGEIFLNVPTVGFWFPRRGNDPESLQELVLTGKRIMAAMLSPSRVAGLEPLVESVMRNKLQEWGTTVDLASDVHPAAYEIALRYFAGDEIFTRYGTDLVHALRAIVNGIDIPRATLAITPARYMMPEYRQTRRLIKILRNAAAEIPESPLFQAIRAVGVHPQDEAFMAMYVVWNAVAYTGSYCIWTLVHVVSDPSVRAALEATDDRRAYLGQSLWETIRLSPISSLVRYLRRPLEFEHAGRRYWLPQGTVVGTAPSLLNRDPRIWADPNRFMPERFSGDAPNPRTALFGSGAFGCVAGEFTRQLIAQVCDAILTARDLTLTEPAPVPRCRVHLLYPDRPIPATAPVRAAEPRKVLAASA